MTRLKDTFKFCTKCRGELESTGEYKKCSKCGKYYYFNGIPTVTIIVINNKQEVLLTKRAVEPFKGWWDLPGGFVDEGETFEQAVARELMEETSLTASSIQYVGSYTEGYHHRGEIHPVVAGVFKAEVDDTTEVMVADDVDGYQFVKSKDLEFEMLAFDNQRQYLKKLLS